MSIANVWTSHKPGWKAGGQQMLWNVRPGLTPEDLKLLIMILCLLYPALLKYLWSPKQQPRAPICWEWRVKMNTTLANEFLLQRATEVALLQEHCHEQLSTTMKTQVPCRVSSWRMSAQADALWLVSKIDSMCCWDHDWQPIYMSCCWNMLQSAHCLELLTATRITQPLLAKY